MGLVCALTHRNMLRALSIADPHFLSLILKVELLSLARGAFGGLWVVIQLQVLLLVHVLHFLVTHERSGSIASVP